MVSSSMCMRRLCSSSEDYGSCPPLAVFLILYYVYRSSQPIVRPLDPDIRLTIQPERHPVKSYAQLPTGVAKQLPKVQYDFPVETEAEHKERVRRKAAVTDAFLHTWNGYKKYAWKNDEITPLSGRFRNPFGGWGASLVDTMDTLWMLGLTKEFEECVEAIKEIDFTTNTEEIINVFETTIRYLGGFLSAYDISEGRYPALLNKAVELANILYMTFDTPNRLPLTRWRWRQSAAGAPVQASKAALLAELGSMSVEFTQLAQLTGDAKWFDAIDRITDFLHKGQDSTGVPGLWSTLVDAETELFFTTILLLEVMYDKMLTAAERYLFYRPLVPGDPSILFSGNTGVDDEGIVVTESQGQHLTCFAGGMVGLAAKVFDRPQDMRVAKELVEGCICAYNSTPTGLMPETFHIASCHVGTGVPVGDECDFTEEKWYKAVAKQHGGGFSKPLAESGKSLADQHSLVPGFTKWGDNRYILRPEAIESVFILYRLTGDQHFLDTAWIMWNNIVKHCKTPFAFAGIPDVRIIPPAQSDRMESFWLAETLKYFIWIYSEPSEYSLDDWVLNTEAHLLRRPRAGEALLMVQA